LQRRDAKHDQSFGNIKHHPAQNGVTRSVPVHTSPLRAPRDEGRRKPMQRTVASVTPRRFNTQEKNEYHHNGQLLMLKNRVENMERERERLAAQTRDQLIAKEKHHAAEIWEKEERIRQLETQIQCLRQENLQSSFQIHNVTMSGSIDVEMADGTAAPSTSAALPTRRVSLPKNDTAWKNISRFGAAASVFANNSTVDRFGNENGSETFAHIPSQMLGGLPVPNGTFRCPQPIYEAPKKIAVTTESKQCQAEGLFDDWNVQRKMREVSLESFLEIANCQHEDIPNGTFRCPQPIYEAPKKISVTTESKQCQAEGLFDDWNVQRKMREVSLESLLRSATAAEDSNFDLSALSRLCHVRDHLELKSHLGTVEQLSDDSFT
ncbi:hypothetical protein COOONC_05474, partial [Cooperia oncophora]